MKLNSDSAAKITFVLLQLGDFVTTLYALETGGGEGNPIVAHFLLLGSLQGLLLAKVLLLAFAVVAVRLKKMSVIRKCNVVYALIVSWNISIIVRLAMQSHAA